MFRIYEGLTKLKHKITGFVAGCIASWAFIISFTIIMMSWVLLHKAGILTVDSADFLIFNLFLSWMAAVQASIILMYSNKESQQDRRNILKGIEMDRDVLDEVSKLNKLVTKVSQLEEIIQFLEKEERYEKGKGKASKSCEEKVNKDTKNNIRNRRPRRKSNTKS